MSRSGSSDTLVELDDLTSDGHTANKMAEPFDTSETDALLSPAASRDDGGHELMHGPTQNDTPSSTTAPLTALSPPTYKCQEHGATLKFWTWQEGSYMWRVSVIFYLIVVVQFDEVLRMVPRTRILELALCRDVQMQLGNFSVIEPGGFIHERHCKLDEIQQQLASLKGALGVLDGLPGFFFAMLFGIMSDSVGRLPVASLVLVGNIAADLWLYAVCYFHDFFPTRAVLYSSLFRLIGGGPAMWSALMSAMLTDVCPSQTRTLVLFYGGAAILLVEAIAPNVSFLFLDNGLLFVPVACGLVFELTGFAILFCMPETHKNVRPVRFVDRPGSSGFFVSNLQALFTRLASVWERSKSSTSVVLLMIVSIVYKVGRWVQELMIQYASVRFGVALRNTNYILSGKAVFTIVYMLAILPKLKPWIERRWQIGVKGSDMAVAIASAACLTFFGLLMGLSPELWMFVTSYFLFGLGSALRECVQSFAAAIVDSADTGSLFAAMSVFEIVGSMITSYGESKTMQAGIRWKDVWMGLPFLLVAGIFAVATINLVVVRALSKRAGVL